MSTTPLHSSPFEEIEANIKTVFEAQRAHTQKLKNTTASERIAKLKALKKLIIENREGLQQAIQQDFRKSPTDTDLTEVLPILAGISHIIKHLSSWMKPKKVATPITVLGSSSKVIYEPKGVCLIISPWNYPFQLTFDPLIYAIASGNAVILKPSELTPHTSFFMEQLIGKLFPPEEVALFEGDAHVAQALLKLPFDHIFFTGSPMLGKVVMRAAAEHLTSVTLELGGKSPVIIDETADIKDAVEKITWGKFINCGQTCIAPDYILVHKNVQKEFIEGMKECITKFYGEDVSKSPDLARIVNQRHFLRIKGLITQSVEQGAKVVVGGEMRESENYISPTLITNVNDSMSLMQEEIFGPVLPVIPIDNMVEATQYVASKPKPLALYFFGKNEQNMEYVLQHSTAGGTCINDTLTHIGNTDLPFGGVNNSGIGKTHGHYGFLAFSNERAVLHQRIGLTTIKLLYPPYTKQKDQLLQMFKKFV
jgi:aldehyde dehydrogenase (NAD+)